MVNRSKAQGTAWERELRRALSEALQVPVRRLAEEGIHDEGDLEFEIAGQRFVVECRDRETMQAHTAVQAARTKAGQALSFVAWKRKRKVPGRTNRVQVGRPIAIMDLQDLITVIGLLGKEQ